MNKEREEKLCTAIIAIHETVKGIITDIEKSSKELDYILSCSKDELGEWAKNHKIEIYKN